MQHTDNLSCINDKLVVALGNFDGLHIGHRALINRVLEFSKQGLKTGVLTFHPHPRALITNSPLPLILTSAEKAFLLREMGVDYYIEYPFTRATAALSPQDFFHEVLLSGGNVHAVVVGEDYRFGHGRAGDAEILKNLCQEHGIEFSRIKTVCSGGKIGSSNLRALIASGKLGQAAQILTRPYFIMGIVDTGRRIGRTLGFPTANLTPLPEKLLPPCGVYVTRTRIGNAPTTYNSITNIGRRPTFNGTGLKIETHIPGLDDNLYGRVILVEFHSFLRPERTFHSPEDLKAQIEADIKAMSHKVK